jgi:hypothetical protein
MLRRGWEKEEWGEKGEIEGAGMVLCAVGLPVTGTNSFTR